MNHFFVSTGKKNLLAISENKPSLTNRYKSYLKNRCVSSVALKPTDECEIIKIITLFNDRKSTGFIEIPVRLIKHSKFVIAFYLKKIFMIACKQELIPTYLKLQRLYPLIKKVVKKRLNITDLSLFLHRSTRFLKKICIKGYPTIGKKN